MVALAQTLGKPKEHPGVIPEVTISRIYRWSYVNIEAWTNESRQSKTREDRTYVCAMKGF
jgi:hypothetical protein